MPKARSPVALCQPHSELVLEVEPAQKQTVDVLSSQRDLGPLFKLAPGALSGGSPQAPRRLAMFSMHGSRLTIASTSGHRPGRVNCSTVISSKVTRLYADVPVIPRDKPISAGKTEARRLGLTKGFNGLQVTQRVIRIRVLNFSISEARATITTPGSPRITLSSCHRSLRLQQPAKTAPHLEHS